MSPLEKKRKSQIQNLNSLFKKLEKREKKKQQSKYKEGNNKEQ